MSEMQRWLLGAVLAGGTGTLAYWRRLLTASGALAATGVGCTAFARGGVPAAGALVAFFASSSALSKSGESRKRRAPLAQAKGARRDAWQVLANGGVATLCLGLGGRRARAGFVGALAAAGADTWATELGMLSDQPPRLITTWRAVEPGTSGGVTPRGLAASVAGAAVVGLAWTALGGGRRRGIWTAVVAGSFGAAVDSMLGATLQAAYRCSACGKLTEDRMHRACGQPTDLVRGVSWVTNDTVNALATLAGAAAGAALG